MAFKAVAFDLGHTLMDERRDAHLPIEVRPIHLMPGVQEAIEWIRLPLALWANTRVARENDVRMWLKRAGIDQRFRWVVTSVDAGVRKPAPEFFQYALARCGLSAEDVLYVGNQLNTDILGAEGSGIRTVWLSSAEYRSDDDAACEAQPTFTISGLHELPRLLD